MDFPEKSILFFFVTQKYLYGNAVSITIPTNSREILSLTVGYSYSVRQKKAQKRIGELRVNEVTSSNGRMSH